MRSCSDGHRTGRRRPLPRLALYLATRCYLTRFQTLMSDAVVAGLSRSSFARTRRPFWSIALPDSLDGGGRYSDIWTYAVMGFMIPGLGFAAVVWGYALGGSSYDRPVKCCCVPGILVVKARALRRGHTS